MKHDSRAVKLKGVEKLGMVQMWISRLQVYLGLMNFSMILYLYITQSPLGVAWYFWVLLIFVMIPIILGLDIKFVFPGSQAYGFGKNPEWWALVDKVDKICEKLGIDNNKEEGL